MNKTSIEWTDYTWNPVTGCDKVSQGCKFCYAETVANRFWGTRKFTDVQMHEDRLNEPQQNKKKWAGKRVFVCSMSDLFHESVTSEFIIDVWSKMYRMPDTIFQILTKRPARALAEINRINENNLFGNKLRNVWIGVSCEDQLQANIRIPLLLQIPAAVRFLSCEPLLGPIDICQSIRLTQHPNEIHTTFFGDKLHWVIAGGESGNKKGVRPMHPDWVRSLRDQCNAANVPFFFKQWGEYWPNGQSGASEFGPDIIDPLADFTYTGNTDQYDKELKRYQKWADKRMHRWPDSKGLYSLHVGKSKSGNTLDGKQHLNFPL